MSAARRGVFVRVSAHVLSFERDYEALARDGRSEEVRAGAREAAAACRELVEDLQAAAATEEG